MLSRHGIFPLLKKGGKSDDQKRATQLSPIRSTPLEKENSGAVSFPEIKERAGFEELNSANNGQNSMEAQLVRKLWERRLILDAFSLENPSLSSILQGHPSLASIMVESEGRSSRGKGSSRGQESFRGQGGGIGRGEVRFPEAEEEREVLARFNLKMAQLEQLLDGELVDQETFRR